MTFGLLFLSAGIMLAGYLPILPSYFFTVCLLLFIIFCSVFFLKKSILRILPIAFAAGCAYGISYGHNAVDDQLLSELVAKDIVVEGRVVDLPQENAQRQLFSMIVDHAYAEQDSVHLYAKFPQKINLGSYGEIRVKPGEYWRLAVKLKQPRGFVNPGGFDYQVSLLRRGIGAVGYIRPALSNQRLQLQPEFSMDGLRYSLQQWLLQKSQSPEKGILIALLVGDTSFVDKEHWGEMIKTGTNHLIAISGLHLGFFAIVGFFFGNFLGKFIQLFISKCPAMVTGYFFSIFCAVFYSFIAGMNIPTLRTLIMLGVVQWVYFWRRSFRGRDTLLLALVLVLLYDPLAAFDMGFWLSFVAVGMLIFCFSGRIKSTPHTVVSLQAQLIEFLKSQWVMFIGLLIPLALLVHTSALLAPPANLIAIPLVTFFVVPCLILAASCHFIFAAGEHFFLLGAESGLSLLHGWLKYLLVLGEGRFNPLINFNTGAIVLSVLSVLLLLAPRGLCSRYLGCCGLVLAFIIPLKKMPPLQMIVFDVGQGTSVLLRTPHHQLLYDTGPQYTENFDAGSALIVPYLQSQDLAHLDSIVVSHNDMDHSGGLAGVLAVTGADKLWLGEPEKYHRTFNDPPIALCHEVQPWRWDEVDFRFITWPLIASAKANNHSCVLQVEYSGHRILLTGDIEKDVERTLLAADALEPVELLLAPHHGSHTSSTLEFVAQTRPRYVIYSAGYHNQHGHPHKDVQQRYDAADAIPLNTAFDGALEFEWRQGKLETIRRYRHAARRYWFSQNTE